MKILVIGSGGREHAIIRKLRENPGVTHIYAFPGNGGMLKGYGGDGEKGEATV